MTRFPIAAFFAAAFLLPGVPSAQVGPALDPGLTVGYAGGEAVHYDNERRSSDRDQSTSMKRARSAHVCGQLPKFRERFGPEDARVRKLTALCRQAGL